eukprot:5312144-Pyramimonas_sp.AAC.1
MLAVSLSAHRLRDHMAAAPYPNGHDSGSSGSMSMPASHMLLVPSEGPAILADQTDGDSVDYYGFPRHSL